MITALLSSTMVPILPLLALVLIPLSTSRAQPLKYCGFDYIYNLGDSISDTGNLIREYPPGEAFCSMPPYGISLGDKKPTGRCSDGLLIIDQTARAAGLPLLNPYLDSKADFRQGANFAVSGSTALPPAALLTRQIDNLLTNSSLDVQLKWMGNFFNKTCKTTQDCKEKHKTALFLVGEIGGNDYNYGFFKGRTPDQMISLVPQVINAIKNAVRMVIQNFGAKNIVVPGNFPVGCNPIYLTAFQTTNSTAYDKNGCLRDFNSLMENFHNKQLQEAIKELQRENPSVKIIYGDYYHAFDYLLGVASRSGFEILKACCGTGGDYNFNSTTTCGFSGVSACSNPEKYISWDGLHYTQEAYKIMADWLIGRYILQLDCFRLY